MLSYYAKHSPNESFQRFTTSRHDGVWVYGDEVKAEDLQQVARQYNLNSNIVRDVTDTAERPRVECADGSLYVFLRTPHRTKRGEVSTTPLLAIATPAVYLTLAERNIFTPETIFEGSTAVRSSDTMTLLLTTFTAVIKEYEELVHLTAHSVKDVSRRLRTHEVSNKDFIHFVTIEDNLNEYHMNLEGMLVVAKRLAENKHQLLSSDDVEMVEDIILYIGQLLSAVSSHSQSVTSIRNAYSTIANHTLNQRMKTLTVLTVLITLPNVIYGMYGMNVALPLADQPWIYGAIVVFTFLLIFVVWGLAKRFKVF